MTLSPGYSKNADLRRNLLIVGALAFVLFLTVRLYWGGLGGPMILDDYPQLGKLLSLDLSDLAYWRGYVESSSGPLGRPVAMSTFLFNAFTAGPDLWGWKYTNLMIHLLAGLMAIWFASVAWAASPNAASNAKPAWPWGLLAGALWLLHPLNVSTVLYTVQRMTQLSALFCFAGMLAYASGRRRQLAHRGGGHTLVALTYVLFLPLAAFSKENGVLLPVFALLLEFYLFRFKGDRITRRVVIAPLVILVVIPFVAGLAYLATHFETVVLARYAPRNFTLPQRLFTELRVVVMYIGDILAPSLGRLGFFHDDVQLSTGWLSPPGTLYCAIVLIVLGAVALLVREWRPMFGFGIALFFVGQSIESTVLPLEIMFEHRNYLPALGILIALVDVIKEAGLGNAVKLAIGCVLLAAFSIVLSLYVGKWASYPKLMTYITRTHSRSPRVRASIAQYLTDQRRYDDALALLAGEPGLGPGLQSLYITCKRDHAIATERLRRETAALTQPLDSYAVSGVIELAREGLDDNCRFDSKSFLALLDVVAARGVPDMESRYKIFIYKSHYLWKMGKSQQAIANLFETQKLLPDDPVPLFLATQWLISVHEMAKAHATYERAVGIAAKSHKDYSTFIESVGEMLLHPQ